MKKILTSLFFVLVFSSLGAQISATTGLTHRPGAMFELRNMIQFLQLDLDQTRELKDFFSVNADSERLAIAEAETDGQIQLIRAERRNARDRKVREILKPFQEPLFETYINDRNNAEVEAAEAPAPETGVNGGR